MPMGYDLIRYLGESLGGRVNEKLVYVFLAYQVVMSALVFLFDSGFPVWLVVAGWAFFLVLLAVLVLRRRRLEKREQEEYWRREQLRLRRIARLQERLKTDPGLQTQCRDCRNAGTVENPCRRHAAAADREFRFRAGDPSYYCLLWEATGGASQQ